jgi:hypothetical protein
MIGLKGWLIPKEKLSSYSLKIRVYGEADVPVSSGPLTLPEVLEGKPGKLLLLDLPPAPLVLSF